jgi:multidrug efflux pump subunit AcrA (membrane-fusion protein)
MRHALTAALVLGVVLAGCGGGDDEGDAKATVTQFFTAIHKQDTSKLCDDLLTKDFIEESTGATGDRAGQECRSQFKSLRATNVKLVKVSKVKIDGDDATVTATVEAQGQSRPQVFRLKKEDGAWRLAGGGTSG